MEIESDGAISYLDIFVIQKDIKLAIKVYRKPPHAG
jgi:hypothetical protein